MKGNDFNPTHQITTIDQHGKRHSIKVMESEGRLYTRAEYEGGLTADWEIDVSRTVTFQGQPAPAGAVRWSIKTLGDARPAASSLEA